MSGAAGGQPAGFSFGSAAPGPKVGLVAPLTSSSGTLGGLNLSVAGTAAGTADPGAGAFGTPSGGLGTAAAATQSSTIVGLNLLQPTPAKTATLSLAGFGTPAGVAATTAATTAAFTAATAATAAPAFGGFSFGGFGGSAAASFPAASASAVATAPAVATPFKGLGGTLTSGHSGFGTVSGSGDVAGVGGAAGGGSGSGSSSTDPLSRGSALDAEVPQEVLATVEAFMRHVAGQRELRARIEQERAALLREIQQTSAEVAEVSHSARRLTVSRDAGIAAAVRLRADVAEVSEQLAMARRGLQLQAWQQGEPAEATRFFQQLLTSADERIRHLRAEIDDLEAALCLDGGSGRVSGLELLAVLRQARDALVSSATQLSAIAGSAEQLRSGYLAHRRALGDFKNPFSAAGGSSLPAAPGYAAAPSRRSGFGPPPCEDPLVLAGAAAAAASAAAAVASVAGSAGGFSQLQLTAGGGGSSFFGGGGSFGTAPGLGSAFFGGAPSTVGSGAPPASLFGGAGGFGFPAAKRRQDGRTEG